MALLPPGARDPVEFAYDWPDLSRSPAWAELGVPEPAFVVADNWRFGGKLGQALGPNIPVCALSLDPREFAFTCDTSKWIGKDAAIVVLKRDADVEAEGARALLHVKSTQATNFPSDAPDARNRLSSLRAGARSRALTLFPTGPIAMRPRTRRSC